MDFKRTYCRGMVLFVWLFGLCTVTTGWAATTASKEYYIKAAYLYNFSKFVTWPSDLLAENDPLHICVLGYQDFNGALGTIEGKQAQGHAVKIVKLDNGAEIQQCQVLYAPSTHEQSLQALKAVQSLPILTVSDLKIEAPYVDLVHVQLLDSETHILFNINLKAIKAHGLVMSSKLVRLAQRVITDEKD